MKVNFLPRLENLKQLICHKIFVIIFSKILENLLNSDKSYITYLLSLIIFYKHQLIYIWKNKGTFHTIKFND